MERKWPRPLSKAVSGFEARFLASKLQTLSSAPLEPVCIQGVMDPTCVFLFGISHTLLKLLRTVIAGKQDPGVGRAGEWAHLTIPTSGWRKLSRNHWTEEDGMPPWSLHLTNLPKRPSPALGCLPSEVQGGRQEAVQWNINLTFSQARNNPTGRLLLLLFLLTPLSLFSYYGLSHPL